jgi:hypothetical protein
MLTRLQHKNITNDIKALRLMNVRLPARLPTAFQPPRSPPPRCEQSVKLLVHDMSRRAMAALKELRAFPKGALRNRLVKVAARAALC